MPLILENAPDVSFREVAGLFIARFDRPTFFVETTTGVPETTLETLGTTLETPKKHQENTKKTPREHQENTKKIILQYLRQQPASSVRELAFALNLSEPSVRHHLRSLQAGNKLQRIGPDKGGHWKIIDEV